jgi:IclR family KDG regulon transcriptional repressor
MSTLKSMKKCRKILDLFVEHKALSLHEITNLVEMPKTTVYRLLCSLVELGFLRQRTDLRYELGYSFLSFAHLVQERLDLRKVALPYMYRLKEEVNEGVNLIVRDGDEGIYIEKVDTERLVRVYTRVGRRAPLYAGACPRILLTFMHEDDQEEYLQKTELQKYASGTITDPKQLREVLRQARKLGYTVSFSELEEYTAAVAAPIRDARGKVLAGLSISGLADRFSEKRLPFLIEKVTKTADRISQELGYLGGKR